MKQGNRPASKVAVDALGLAFIRQQGFPRGTPVERTGENGRKRAGASQREGQSFSRDGVHATRSVAEQCKSVRDAPDRCLLKGARPMLR
jgi:hypothetical protein